MVPARPLRCLARESSRRWQRARGSDAVLVPEVGKLTPEARRGYQVHFAERPLDMIAHGGELLSDKPSDVMVIDVVAMDCCWTREDRATVIRNIHAALADACGMKAPSPAWWINFRVIEEGSWGSRGGVLSSSTC